MNSLVFVLMLIIGAVLVYSAIKGGDPREIIKKALTTGNAKAKGK
jgi:hypothetical protein